MAEGYSLGALSLCFLVIHQRMQRGVDPYELTGLLVAVIFGGAAGSLVAVLIWRTQERTEHLEKTQRELERRFEEIASVNDNLTREIYERRAAEEALIESRRRYRLLFESAPDGLTIVDAHGTIADCNKGAELLYGYPREELIGKAFEDLAAESLRPILVENYRLLKNLAQVEAEIRVIKKDGTTAEVWSKEVPLTDLEGNFAGILGYGRDISRKLFEERERDLLISELIVAKKALEFQASHDGLTGLWNRPSILDQLGRELARSKRQSLSTGLIMADVDHFKQINDLYGHQVGDVVLAAAAERMVSLVRPYDCVGRYGGEEFLILCPTCDPDEAAAIAERLRAAFEETPLETPKGPFSITLSLGVVTRDGQADLDGEQLIRAADEALYTAKARGRNRVEVRRNVQ
ncbi:MAG: diguanylate cyclase [Pseudomonadota bacterium]